MSLNQEKIDKWKSVLGQMGVTGSKADFLSEYAELHNNNEAKIEESSNDLPNLLPITMKITAKTIGQDLVTVAPIGGGNSGDEMKKIKQEVKIENRDRKINAVVEEEYKEMKPNRNRFKRVLKIKRILNIPHINVFNSPGIYVQETDINFITHI